MAPASFEEIISQLPFPVAFRCRFILTRADKRSALENIIDAYESLLKFLALVMISDYLRGMVEEPAIDRRLKKLFGSRISAGHWGEILREITRFYTKSADMVFLPELLKFYFIGERPTAESRLFEGWIKRRNSFRGHAKHLITDSFVEKTWTEWWPEFKKLIEMFAFLTSYEMIIPTFIQRGIIRKAQICTGPDQFFIFNNQYDLPLNITGAEPEESLLLIDKRNPGRQLLLYPFIVVKAAADFYLFERGERQKGNLDRVVFSSLGPGEALEVRRRDEDWKIIADLEKRLSRLGEIGICINGSAGGASQCDQEPIILLEVLKAATTWAEAGYPYHLIEGLNETLKAFIRHPQETLKIKDNIALAFLLVAALHHGGNWCYWVRKNIKNPDAVNSLAQVLVISYTRPRFRTLYALQLFAVSGTLELPDNWKNSLDPDMHKIIEKYVATGKVTDYLSLVKQKADPELAKKAAAVLREIGQYGENISTGKKSSGLPNF